MPRNPAWALSTSKADEDVGAWGGHGHQDSRRFSMRAVAADAGITATAIYRHYSDKDGLTRALLERERKIPGGYPLSGMRGAFLATSLLLRPGRRWLGVAGLLAAAQAFGMNVWKYPAPPAEEGGIDAGPYLAAWFGLYMWFELRRR